MVPNPSYNIMLVTEGTLSTNVKHSKVIFALMNH